jgi:EAL domain-containing protein (putative c-di-GMP-specific phosphodiesterase class I)
MRNADTAMYQAKALGKNQHITFHPSMYESSLRRYNLQTDLVRALECNELQAHYQPILDLASKRVVGAEALVRWQHPTLGLLTPDAFLHVAAESGVLGDIDMLVLDQACGWLVETDARLPGSVESVNVNFSPQSFRAGGLTERILQTCRRHDLDPVRLCVEITEDLMADDVEAAMRTLRSLQQHHIRVALDDFGTGYSSLSQLRMLAVDTIKIPKPFVDDLDGVPEADGTEEVFAAAIVALSRALNKSVVAEGIERPQQLAVLEQLGCQFGQGYLFARPMDSEAMLGFLATQQSSASVSSIPGRHG